MSHSFIGSHLLALSLPAALAGGLFFLAGLKRARVSGLTGLLASAERAVHLNFFLVTGAVVVLVSAFLSNDYSVLYVFRYSNITLPLFYKVTGLWAGLDGSLLFWTWLVSLYALIVVRQNRRTNPDWVPYVSIVLMGIVLFFVALMLFANNPFTPNDQPAVDGKGLNPLLQNLAMVFHPPTLYLGYTGFSVPFAFVVAALLSGRLDSTWIDLTRKWTLTAWFFLTVGLILGGAWAYVELGWGGFWAWDPVENAALMPWLTATAYLHSVMIQKKRGMLFTWNVVLVSLTFMLTLFGTYLTRSGIVESVHAFSESKLGPYFLSFLGAIFVGTAILVFIRRDKLRSQNIFLSFLSKEAAFLFNNIVLLVGAMAVLWGTLFPTISEALTGERISVGIPFFNKIMAPLGLLLLFLMGIGPMISWKKASVQTLCSNLLGPFLAGLLALGVGLFFFGLRQWYALGSLFLLFTVLGTLFLEFFRGWRAVRQQDSDSGFVSSFASLIFRSNRRYGGYIVHLGILLIFAGIAGAVFKKEADFSLKPAETFQFAGYSFLYEEPSVSETSHKTEFKAVVSLFQGKRKIDLLTPAKFFYHSSEQPSTEVDIFHALFEDVYLIIGGLDPETGRAEFRVTINPLISCIWVGGFVILLGLFVLVMPRGGRMIGSSGRVVMALVLLLSIWFPSGWGLAQENQRLDPIVSKLLCQCGDCVRMSLKDCPCSFAQKERSLILGLLAEGKGGDEIVESFVARYGLHVLAQPPARGFFRAGYVMPPLLLILGVVVGVIVIRRWKRGFLPADNRGKAPDIPNPYAKKLLKELGEYR